MLSTDLALGLDPVKYASASGFDLDPWQKEVVRTRARRVSLCITRQGGKSTGVAIKAMHTATYYEDSLILLLAPGLRQASELFRKCQVVKNSQQHPPKPVSETKLSLELANGSRIVSLPGGEATLRGFSGPAQVIFDEASRIPDPVYQAVRPMISRAPDAQLFLLSTPFGRRGFFYTEHVESTRYQKYNLTASECPHISSEFLEEEREVLGDYWFQQEYMLAFHDAQNAAFQKAYIDAAIDEGVSEWDLVALSDLQQHLTGRP